MQLIAFQTSGLEIKSFQAVMFLLKMVALGATLE